MDIAVALGVGGAETDQIGREDAVLLDADEVAHVDVLPVHYVPTAVLVLDGLGGVHDEVLAVPANVLEALPYDGETDHEDEWGNRGEGVEGGDRRGLKDGHE